MVISGKFHAKKHYDQLFSTKKKKIPSEIPKWSFSDLETKPEAPFGNQKIFFLKI